jgi:hypothetical protein
MQGRQIGIPFPILDLNCTSDTFNIPVQLKVVYTESLIPDPSLEESLWFVHFDPSNNEFNQFDNSNIDVDGNFIEVSVTHFSYFVYAIIFHFKWHIDVIDYYIYPDNSGRLWGTQQNPYSDEGLVIEAIEKWEPYQCNFTFNRVFDPNQANILIKPVPRIRSDASGIAHVAFHWGAQHEDDQINIGINYNYDPESILAYDEGKKTVISHEVGHALGLYHCGSSPSPLPDNSGSAPPMMSAPSDGNIALDRQITQRDLSQFQRKYGEPCENRMLYIASQNITTLITPNVPGSHYMEISMWQNAGLDVTTMSTMPPASVAITPELLEPYEVLRLVNYNPKNYTVAEGNAIYNWVNNGGKLLADIHYNADVNAVSNFGVDYIEGAGGGYGGLDWFYHGAPLYIGPVTGPFSSGVTSIGIEAMDRPHLKPNHQLNIAASYSGYPAVVYRTVGSGKVVITFDGGSYSLDVVHPGNAYRSCISYANNLQFVQNIIDYFEP